MILRLLWSTSDPEGTALRLASSVGGRVEARDGRDAGDPDGGGIAPPMVPLSGGTVTVVASGGAPDRLILPDASAEAPEADEADRERRFRGSPVLLGVGWATVDADRAVLEVATALGVGREAFRPATDDGTLGARVLLARLGPLSIATLEPSTEGRVAAALARCGEGPCAIYVASSATGTPQAGPFGPAWLVMADRPWGPFVVAVRRRAAAPR